MLKTTPTWPQDGPEGLKNVAKKLFNKNKQVSCTMEIKSHTFTKKQQDAKKICL
jgi:hypothetical protein